MLKIARKFVLPGLSLLATCVAHAAPIIDFASGTGNNTVSGVTQIGVGSKFSVGASPFLVDQVGVYQVAGVSQSGTWRLYMDGQTTNLLSATFTGIEATQTSANGNVYTFLSITPFLLSAGTTYDIIFDFPANSQLHAFGPTVVSTSPDVTFITAIAAAGAGQFPMADSFAVGPYFGPTFSGSASAPELDATSLPVAAFLMVTTLLCAQRQRRPVAS